MSKRFFYDCPIKAAYMAKEFGVIYLRGDQGIATYEGFLECKLGNCNPPFYVHKESESIFEPEEGDPVMFEACKEEFQIGKIVDRDSNRNKWEISLDQTRDTEMMYRDDFEIIRRDNKNFFDAEVEE